MLEVMERRGIVIDVGIGTIYPNAIRYGVSQEMLLIY